MQGCVVEITSLWVFQNKYLEAEYKQFGLIVIFLGNILICSNNFFYITSIYIWRETYYLKISKEIPDELL